MKLYLTESQLATIILEAMNVQDIYDQYYSDIDQNLYNKVVQADPTFDGQKMGKYTKWLLGLVRRGNLKEGDLGEATDLLGVFEKYKNRVEVKDVTRLRSMSDLYDVVKPFMEGNQATSKSDEQRQLKAGAEKAYEDGKWLIIIPHTKEASCLYGKGTKWCTAGEGRNMFDYYNDQGKLYINIDKESGKKYQFHFETNSFMTEKNMGIRRPIAPTIGLTQGALNYYSNVVGKIGELSLTTDGSFTMYKNFGILKGENGGYYFVSKDGNIGKETYIGYVAYNRQPIEGFLLEKNKNVYRVVNGKLEFDGTAELKGRACEYINDCSIVEYIFDNIRLCSQLLYKGRVILNDIRGYEFDNIDTRPRNGIVFFRDRDTWRPFVVKGMKEIKPKKDWVRITNCTDFDSRDERGLYAEVELNYWKHVYKMYTDGELKKIDAIFNDELEDDPDEPDYSTIE